mmetsp:Transcript_56834/g.112909  ORF Transcript_56834/g.112909 Transcript_56834/m.112909 type:complete len:216 (+) Transcript_56834:144-791(+)
MVKHEWTVDEHLCNQLSVAFCFSTARPDRAVLWILCVLPLDLQTRSRRDRASCSPTQACTRGCEICVLCCVESCMPHTFYVLPWHPASFEGKQDEIMLIVIRHVSHHHDCDSNSSPPSHCSLKTVSSHRPIASTHFEHLDSVQCPSPTFLSVLPAFLLLHACTIFSLPLLLTPSLRPFRLTNASGHRLPSGPQSWAAGQGPSGSAPPLVDSSHRR